MTRDPRGTDSTATHCSLLSTRFWPAHDASASAQAKVALAFASRVPSSMPDTTFHIVIPAKDWNGRAADIRSRLVTWEWHWKLPKGRVSIELDFTKVSFMEPWALAMFAAYGLKLRQEGFEVRARLDPKNPSNVYFDQMGLPEVLDTGLSRATASTWAGSERNTGLHVIRGHEDVARFRDSASRLALEHCEDAADALQYAMTELARNVIQHSGSPIGGIAIAQHFPDQKALQVAICDLGQGVRSSLQPRYPELRTDLESLRLAVLPHASGAKPATTYGSGLENAGLGLFYSREIAWRAGGSFWLASGRALLGIRGDVPGTWDKSPAEPARVYRTIEPWPGTVAVVDFPSDGVVEFSGILKVCRELSDEARRLSGPAGLDFLGTRADVNVSDPIRVREFEENNTQAIAIREQRIRPRVEAGETVWIDFDGVRSPTQSFVHVLLADIFKIPGSLMRLSFLHCTPSAREVIKAVATYASYRQIV